MNSTDLPGPQIEENPNEKIISFAEVISQSKSLGVDFGSGDPYNRLRYYTKIGLLPNAVRKSFAGQSPTGAYPESVVNTLVEIDSKLKSGQSIQSILRKEKNDFIPFEKIVSRAKAQGVDFGSGDPNNRLRYYTKIGLLPNAVRRGFDGKPPVGAYPENVVNTLVDIDKNLRSGKSIQALLREKQAEIKPLTEPEIAATVFEPNSNETTPVTLLPTFQTAPAKPVLEIPDTVVTPLSQSILPTPEAKKRNFSWKLASWLVLGVMILGLSGYFVLGTNTTKQKTGLESLGQIKQPEANLSGVVLGSNISPYFSINVETDVNGILHTKAGIKTEGTNIDLGNGKINFQANNFVGSLSTATLTNNQTITLPNQSGTICLSAGNCSGAGGGVSISSSGTIGTIPVFTSSQNIANSILSQNGFNILVNGSLSIATLAGPSATNLCLNGNFLSSCTASSSLLFTPGSVIFAGSAGTLSQDNPNFFFDNTNKYFGLGTNSPSSTLDVRSSLSSGGLINLQASSATTLTGNLNGLAVDVGGYTGGAPSGGPILNAILVSNVTPNTAIKQAGLRIGTGWKNAILINEDPSNPNAITTITSPGDAVIKIGGNYEKNTDLVSLAALNFSPKLFINASPGSLYGDLFVKINPTYVLNQPGVDINSNNIGVFAYGNFQVPATGASGSHTVNAYVGFSTGIDIKVLDPAASLTITDVTDFYAGSSSPFLGLGIGANATVTNRNGLLVGDQTPIGGTLTNQYGVRVQNLSAGSKDYAFYSEGADTANIYARAATSNTATTDVTRLENTSATFTGDYLDISGASSTDGVFDLVLYSISGTSTTSGTVTTIVTSEAASLGGNAFTLAAAANDSTSFGESTQFFRLYVDIAAPASSAGISWQYCSANSATNSVCDTWSNLPGVSDGTSNLTLDGTVTWAAPANWIQSAETGLTPRYFVRAFAGSITGGPATAYSSAIAATTSGNYLRVGYGGNNIFTLNNFGAASLTTPYVNTTPLTITAPSSNTSTTYGINISGITNGAGTESAINVGTGWDNILTGSFGALTSSATGVSINHNSTTTSGTVTSFASTLGITNSSTAQNGLLITPSTSASAGTLTGVNIGDLTATGGSTSNEVGVKVGANWDYGVWSASRVRFDNNIELTSSLAAPDLNTEVICRNNTTTNLLASCAASGGVVGNAFVHLAPQDPSSPGNPLADIDNTTRKSIFINKTGASGDLINMQVNAVEKFKVDYSGNLTNSGTTVSTGSITSNTSLNTGTITISGTTISSSSILTLDAPLDWIAINPDLVQFSAATQEFQIYNSGSSTLRISNPIGIANLTVSGSITSGVDLTSTANLYVNGNSTLGNNSGDAITLTGSLFSNVNFLDGATFGIDYNVNGSDATTNGNAGGNLTLKAGNGLTTGAGGNLTLNSGTSPSGTSGNVILQTGGTERFRAVQDGTFLFEKGANDLALVVTAPTGASRTATIPSLTANDTFCLVSLGNCGGSGGGVTTIGGTAGRLSKFSGTQAIVDSLLNETGSNIDLTSGNLLTSGTTRLTSTGALQNIASLQFLNSTFTATLQTAILTASGGTYTLPNTAGLADTVCLVTAGNCAGSGTGVTTAGGTSGRIAKFTGAQAIGNSLINETGGNIDLTSGDFLLSSITRITGAGAGTFTTVNALTLTSQTDGFTIAGGTTPRTLTMIGMDLTLGSTIKPTTNSNALAINTTSANLTLQTNTSGTLGLTSAGAINLTAAAASRFQFADGIANSLVFKSNLFNYISIGDAADFSGNSQNISLDVPTGISASSSRIDIGNSSTSKTINIGGGTSTGALTIKIGNTNASTTTSISSGTTDGNGVIVYTDSLTSGTGLLVSAGTNTTLTSGNLFSVSNNDSLFSDFTTRNFSGNTGSFYEALNKDSTGTLTRSGNLLSLTRDLYKNSGTLTVTGALLSVNNTNPFAGVITDSANLIKLTQSDYIATGALLQINNDSGSSTSLVIANTFTTTLADFTATGTGTTATGLKIQNTSSGVITNALDVSDPEIVNALSIGTNSIAGTDFNVRSLSTNFGAIAETGGFASLTSYFGEEFSRERADITTAAVLAWGDATEYGLALNGSCTTSILDNNVNGISRLSALGISGCALYNSGTAAATANTIFAAANRPVVYMKVRPTQPSAARTTILGLTNLTATRTTDLTGAGENGIYFSNFNGSNTGDTNWYGKVSVNGTVTTTSSCGAINFGATQYAVLKIQVISTTSVEFWIDRDSTDGISFTLCGTLTTTPSVSLNSYMETSGSNAGGGIVDIDYIRIWQDDVAAQASVTGTFTPDPGVTKNLTVSQNVTLPSFVNNLGSKSDIAENYSGVDGTLIAPGNLVSISSNNKISLSSATYDKKLVGIVSSDPDQTLGNEEEGSHKVSLTGQVLTKVSTENGPIEPGDPITSSSVPGIGMKATESGPIVGKALSSFNSDNSTQTGEILVLVTTSYYSPPLMNNQPIVGGITQDLFAQNLLVKDTIKIGDKITFDKDGKVVVNGEVIVAGSFELTGNLTIKGNIDTETVAANEFVIKSKGNSETAVAGTAIIKAGTRETIITTKKTALDSLIFVTPTIVTDKALAVVEKISGDSFKVTTSDTTQSDISFNWIIVNQLKQ